MLRFAVKNLWSYKLRTLLVSLAIVLGVGFIAGTLVLTDSIQQGFDNLFKDAYSQVDFIVRQESVELDHPELEDRSHCQTSDDPQCQQLDGLSGVAEVDDLVVSQLKAVDGVAIAELVIESQVLLTDLSGDPIWQGALGGIGRAFSWPTQANISPLSLVADSGSRAPQNAHEIVIDQTSSQKYGLEIGDKVKVESLRVSQPAEEVTIVGLAAFGSSQQLSSFVALSLEESQRFFESDAAYEVYIQASPGADKQTLQASLEQAISPGLTLLTTDQLVAVQTNDIQTSLSFVSAFLLTFAGVAIFVAVFVIQNTFRIILGQRTRELALLRVIGANKRQIRQIVRYEALLIGILGSILGLFVGIALAALASSFLADSLPLQTNVLVVRLPTVIISLLVGSSVAAVSAFLPAIKASRVAPLEALVENEITPTARASLVRTIIGAVTTGLGGAALAHGLAGATGDGVLFFTGLGSALMFIGITILAPVLARPVAYLLSRPLELIFSISAKLAHANIRRQPRQMAAAASTLMIGVSLIVLATVLASSFKATIQDVIDKTFPADLTIYSNLISPIPSADGDQPTEGIISPELVEDLNSLAEVRDVTSVRYSIQDVRLEPSDKAIDLAGIDTRYLDNVLRLKFSEGASDSLAEGQLVVRDQVVDDQGWQIGDNITLNFNGQISSYRLGGTFEEIFDTSFILSSQEYLELIDHEIVTYIIANAADGVSSEVALETVRDHLSDYSSLTVYDKGDLIEEAERAIDLTLSILKVLLGLSLVIAIFGIVNTLFLAVIERTRELGLLRAVGMTRRQLRQMIRVEAIIIAIFGAFLGTSLGLIFGWAIIRAISASQGNIPFVIPAGEIALYLSLAILAGILASIWPAFKASRLDILKAISHQ